MLSLRIASFIVVWILAACGRVDFERRAPGVDAGTIDAGGMRDAGYDAGARCPGTFLFRRRIAVAVQPGAETLGAATVLVRLDASRIEYTMASEAGIMFGATDGTELAHEIERWDPSGSSYVWARLDASTLASADPSFFMYYGGSEGPGPRPADVWSGWDAVWHLQPTSIDSTGRMAPAISRGAMPSNEGLGGAYVFDGTGFIDLGASLPLVEGASAITLSAWVRPVASGGERNVISLAVEGDPSSVSRGWISLVGDGTIVRAGGRAIQTEATHYVDTDASVRGDAFQHITAVLRLDVDQIDVYIDGVERASVGETDFAQRTTADAPVAVAAIGAEDDGSGGFFIGTIDEVRIAAGAETPPSIALQSRSLHDTLLEFGPREDCPR